MGMQEMHNGDETRNYMQHEWPVTNNAYKLQDAHSSVETRASTKSPNSGADADEYQLMDELVDAEALACSMPPQMTRLPGVGDDVYYNMAEPGQGVMSPSMMAPQSPMGQQVMEMPANMPMQMMPSNAPVMYTSMGMQQGGPQVQMQWPMQGAMQGQQGQYVQVPMMMPVRMVPVPVPMQMGAQMGAAG